MKQLNASSSEKKDANVVILIHLFKQLNVCKNIKAYLNRGLIHTQFKVQNQTPSN